MRTGEIPKLSKWKNVVEIGSYIQRLYVLHLNCEKQFFYWIFIKHFQNFPKNSSNTLKFNVVFLKRFEKYAKIMHFCNLLDKLLWKLYKLSSPLWERLSRSLSPKPKSLLRSLFWYIRMVTDSFSWKLLNEPLMECLSEIWLKIIFVVRVGCLLWSWARALSKALNSLFHSGDKCNFDISGHFLEVERAALMNFYIFS